MGKGECQSHRCALLRLRRRHMIVDCMSVDNFFSSTSYRRHKPTRDYRRLESQDWQASLQGYRLGGLSHQKHRRTLRDQAQGYGHPSLSGCLEEGQGWY